jgi:acetylornithine aminotransferase
MASKRKNVSQIHRWEHSLEGNYGTPTISLVRGKGCEVWDADGKKYLDFLGGIATNLLGHAHPKVIAAVTKQMKTLSHVSNFYAHENVLSLAEKLKVMAKTPDARVFFCNSGAEANEAALKISRLTGRYRIISTQGAFHGRTMGALSLTGQPAKRAPFIPLLKGVKFVPYGDIAAMRRSITRKIAMVIIEPIQGENGVVVPPVGYLKVIRELCDQTGTLLCIDAVQTGMGRTGEWFGYESEKITPDLITLAKGLGGGLPLGAVIINSEKHFSAGEHGTTFGGNPVTTAAALATINEIESKKLMANAARLGVLAKKNLAKIPGVQEVRGKGLLIGIVLNENVAKNVASQLQTLGVLVNAPQPNVIRVAPALNVTTGQVNTFIKKLTTVMNQVHHE